MTEAPRRWGGARAWVFGMGLLVGLALAAWQETARVTSRVAARAPLVARTGEAPRALTLEALRLSDTLGVPIDFARAGVPQVVMINSTTCGVCTRALADFRDASARGPLVRLAVVTIEGADSGAILLRAARLVPAQVLGPANEGARSTLTFQFPGTPVFLALDSAARVIASLPGYPGREAMVPWVDVMAGRRASPE